MATKTTEATSAPAVTLLTGVKAIETALTSIQRRGTQLQGDVHVALCSVLAHVSKHKDVRLIDRAIEVLPDMVRKQAVAKWFEAFGPVTFEDEQVSYVPGKRTLLGDAMAKPFYSFNPKQDYVPLTPDMIAASLDKLVKRLQTDTKKTKANHAALINALRAIKPSEMTAH